MIMQLCSDVYGFKVLAKPPASTETEKVNFYAVGEIENYLGSLRDSSRSLDES